MGPFECNICQAAFTRQHSLNYHLMTHANQTRFTCPHCSRKFRHPTHFKDHVKKHGEVVQFRCEDCPASYTVQNQYKRHLKVRHGKTLDILGNIVEISSGRQKTTTTRKQHEDDQNNPKRKRRRKPKNASKSEDVPAAQHLETVPGHLATDYHYGDTTSNDEEVEEF